MSDLEKIINDAFEERDNINVNTAGDIRNAVDETLNKNCLFKKWALI